jgi:flagellar biosynthetic protein FlhB
MKHTILYIPSLKGSHDLVGYLLENAKQFLLLVLPVMLVLCAVAVLANYLQTGMIFSVEPLAPKASKINPVSGLKRLFSKRSLVELVIVGWAAASTLMGAFDRLMPLIYQETGQIMSLLGSEAMRVMIKCCWVITILAILDYFYQRWEHEQSLKMTKQEVKDEYKQTEGDPLVKSRIRSIQREMARRRMMEEVPKADVIITNPVHLAVALRYNPERMHAPTVTAKGAENLAERIKKLAREHDIPVIENRPLAQNLYHLDLGQEIPAETYQAVAEILAYVYGLKSKRPPGHMSS